MITATSFVTEKQADMTNDTAFHTDTDSCTDYREISWTLLLLTLIPRLMSFRPVPISTYVFWSQAQHINTNVQIRTFGA